MHGAALIFIILAVLAVLAGLFSSTPSNLACYAAANGLCVIADLLDHSWTEAAANSAIAVLALICWWLSRRRRRRSPKLAGAKSKARLAAVVRTLRERTVPRPVYRPQPQGA